MSGPKSAHYTLAGSLAEQRRTVEQRQVEAAERRRAEAERQRREAEARARAVEARRREQARQERLAGVRSTRRRLAIVREQLSRAIAKLPPDSGPPSVPELPEIADESMESLDALQQTLDDIGRRLDEIRARVDTAHALAGIDFSGLGAAQTLDQVLDRFLHAAGAPIGETNADTGISSDDAARRDAVRRIAGRLVGVSLDELPAALEALVQRVLSVDGFARFDMLCTELRLQVQQHNERIEARRRGSALAGNWLERLAPLDVEGGQADLRETLADVRNGHRPWNGDLDTACTKALRELEAAAQWRRDARASDVLEATLRDLGYTVEGIAETLFAEGGTVHFQGRGWDDYFMRLRVSPERGSLHFNMVRADDAPASAQRDLEMEQQWCNHYPELMRNLAARGIEATPLRALAAGSFEVEAVRRDALPRRQAQSQRRAAPAAAKSLDR